MRQQSRKIRSNEAHSSSFAPESIRTFTFVWSRASRRNCPASEQVRPCASRSHAFALSHGSQMEAGWEGRSGRRKSNRAYQVPQSSNLSKQEKRTPHPSQYQSISEEIMSAPAPNGANTAAAPAANDARDPSGFLSEIIGAPVTVKLNSGVVYKGMCLLVLAENPSVSLTSTTHNPY